MLLLLKKLYLPNVITIEKVILTKCYYFLSPVLCCGPVLKNYNYYTILVSTKSYRTTRLHF